MHIFFPSSKKGNRFVISGEELKHLKVRRISPGEELGIIWEEKIYLCRLSEERKREALCEIVGEIETKKPKVEITLYQAVTVDLKTFDMIVQKATELGVVKLVPTITERSFRRREVLLKRMERWRRISKEAMKQSGRPYEMLIEKPTSINSLKPEHELNIILDNFYEGIPVRELKLSGIKKLGIVVGPEGGFSEREGSMLREKGFTSVRLEPYTLRSETAMMVSVGIIVNLAGS